MASYATLAAEVTYRLGNRTDLTARIPIWLNDAYFDLLLSPLYSFYELDKQGAMATIESLRAYDLPSDLWFILSLRDDTNQRKLDRKHWQEYDRRNTTSTGLPTSYARFGQTVELDPTPDDEYDIIMRYRKRPTEISSTQAPETGREWDEILVLKTVVNGFEALEQQERAAQQKALLNDKLAARMDVPQLEDADSEAGLEPRFD